MEHVASLSTISLQPFFVLLCLFTQLLTMQQKRLCSFPHKTTYNHSIQTSPSINSAPLDINSFLHISASPSFSHSKLYTNTHTHISPKTSSPPQTLISTKAGRQPIRIHPTNTTTTVSCRIILYTISLLTLLLMGMYLLYT